MLNEDREDQEDDGRDDEPELFLQGVLVMMMFMTFVVMMVFVTFVVVMMFVRRMGLMVVMVLVVVLIGAALVAMVFM